MFRPSLRIFRRAVNRMSLKLMSKNIKIKTTDLRCNSQMVTSKFVPDKKNESIEEIPSRQKDIKMTVKLLNIYQNPESICWDQFKKKMEVLNIPSKDHGSVILQACLRLHDLDTGISYFNYVIKRGEELPIFELVFFIKLFSNRKDQISKYENVIKHLYENMKVYLKSSPVLQNYLMELIAEVPSCFYDFVKNCSEEFSGGKMVLAKKALELKNAKIAYEIMSHNDFKISGLFENYLDYLCLMAKENKFSPNMITSFIKLCEDKNNVIANKNFLPLVKNLVDTLSKHVKDYMWTLKKCDISDSNICSKCNTKLVDKCISESDFSVLKKAFLPDAGLIKKNVFLSTSNEELQKFLQFLDNSKPYNIVIDGLNIIYHSKSCANGELSRFLKYFLDKGLHVLIVARIHARNQITQISFLKKKQYQNKCQFFFTENLSDDDVFILYAALHGGLGTYLFSGDFLQRYGARFSDELKRIFCKWKLYHQYIPKDFKLYPPRPSLGLPQLTVDEKGKMYIWHISYSSEYVDENRLNSSVPLNWICLQAKKKLPQESSAK